MRLNKYIASCGIASRRGADTLIADGKVTVNGALVQVMGLDVCLGKDIVCVDDVPIAPQTGMIYIMLNKPANTLCACSDDRGRTTVIDLLDDVDSRVFPVGRLDYDTEGLLLLTNDGDFAYQCTHPKHEVSKKYFAIVKGMLSDNAIQTLSKGVAIDGTKTSPAKIELQTRSSKRTALFITIHEGKNRQIKKMFLLAGCRVSYLKRIAIGGLTLGNLAPGKYRSLTKKDIALLDINIVK